MKPSEFLKCYKALVHLYDAILFDDAYKILKHYYPKLLKKELQADLKTRLGKLTRFYSVYTAGKDKFIICNDFMSYEDVAELFYLQEGKEYYIPETLEEFFEYSEPTYVEVNFAYQRTVEYMVETFKLDEKFAYLQTKLMVGRMQNGFRLQDTLDDIEKFYEFKDLDDVMKFAKIYQLLNNNTRFASNKGHTPAELSDFTDKAELESKMC